MHHPIRTGGPRTDAGKAAASQNATKHGLTARTHHTLANENPETWARVASEHVKAYAPANAVEHGLVEEIAFASWKLRRLARVETGLFDIAMETQAADLAKQFRTPDESIRTACAFEYLAEGRRSIALLTRYQAQIERSRERAIKALGEMQDRRKKEEKEANKAGAAAEKASAQNVKRRSEPSKLQRYKRIAEMTKRTTGHPDPGRPSAAAKSQINEQAPRTGPEPDQKGGPNCEKAA